MIGISEAASLLGVSEQYLRTVGEDRLPVFKTKGGHRRYQKEDILRLIGKTSEIPPDVSNKTIIYSRVSSQEQLQKGELDRQKLRNIEHCLDNGYEIVGTYEECSSGMNDNRPKLHKIMQLANESKFGKLVIEHKDRLTRFNFNIYSLFFKSFGVEIVIVLDELPKSFENELVEDMLTLIQSFRSKIYGRRSNNNNQK